MDRALMANELSPVKKEAPNCIRVECLDGKGETYYMRRGWGAPGMLRTEGDADGETRYFASIQLPGKDKPDWREVTKESFEAAMQDMA